MYYFHKTEKVFLHDSVHADLIEKDKDLLIEVSDDDFSKFIDLRARGHEIYVNKENQVQASIEASPSQYHTWNGKKWVISAENKKRQTEDEANALKEQAQAAINLSSAKIQEFNNQKAAIDDQIEFADYGGDKGLELLESKQVELDNIIKTWKMYRIDCAKVMRGERTVLPPQP